ncbi:phosphoenolpyruvate synthase [Candidatus Curtissbacteria bacterium]|nr:phosphoenolpyruvate synthase [Candidatus Curtissbacteria bacterium]
MENIVWFEQVDKNDGVIVGGKGANLGELTRFKIPIPNGFIITSQAYFQNVRSSGALDRIKGLLYGLNVDDPLALQKAAEGAQKEIKNIQLDSALARKIDTFYNKLSQGKDYVAVRSSATAEDLPSASFAGQQATFLNIRGKKALKEAILSTWASLFEGRSIFYRVQKKFDHFKVGIAVPVQKMVQSEVSGVMFTVDPITNDKGKIIIESAFGLGELIVSGQVTPDHYEVDKKTLQITKKNIQSQDKQLVKSKNGNKLITIAREFRKTQKLPDEKIIELARLGARIEKHYFFPQDIEWAYENKKLYIVQTRPVTTLENGKLRMEDRGTIHSPFTIHHSPILTGSPASPIIATGTVVVINSPKELTKVQKGDVLVAKMTNPDYVQAMKKAAAVITEKGGRTSHAAIVAREFGISCIVGAEGATHKLKSGMTVTVDGAKGLVFEGSRLKPSELHLANKESLRLVTKTATKLLVNLSSPQMAVQIAAKPVDGIGLLRAEFILAEIGTHPKVFLKEGKKEDFINMLSDKLVVFAKAFGERSVIYRASDLKSNEYKDLKGGDKFEPKEANPMLGYRGAFRYVKDPDVFKLELSAILQVRQKHPNLQLMIPFVRTPNELKNVKEMVEEANLFKDPSFQFWMMAEIPANVILLEQFLKLGIDGVSIGSNDLTMLILGTDRDNEEVASQFNEMDKAVLWALEKVVKTCVKNRVLCSICGQAPSVYPELVEKLISWGISSISVNPDRIDDTRQLIYETEKKLVASH